MLSSRFSAGRANKRGSISLGALGTNGLGTVIHTDGASMVAAFSARYVILPTTLFANLFGEALSFVSGQVSAQPATIGAFSFWTKMRCTTGAYRAAVDNLPRSRRRSIASDTFSFGESARLAERRTPPTWGLRTRSTRVTTHTSKDSPIASCAISFTFPRCRRLSNNNSATGTVCGRCDQSLGFLRAILGGGERPHSGARDQLLRNVCFGRWRGFTGGLLGSILPATLSFWGVRVLPQIACCAFEYERQAVH